jgi:hypothetical protein
MANATPTAQTIYSTMSTGTNGLSCKSLALTFYTSNHRAHANGSYAHPRVSTVVGIVLSGTGAPTG